MERKLYCVKCRIRDKKTEEAAYIAVGESLCLKHMQILVNISEEINAKHVGSLPEGVDELI